MNDIEYLQTLEQLSHKRRQLEELVSFPTDYYERWAGLAKEYKAIDAEDNYQYCLSRSWHYEPEQEELDWQKRLDIGD